MDSKATQSEEAQPTRSAARRKRPRKPLSEAQRILIKMPNWLGDAVMSLPAVECLRKLYPRAWIACLIQSNLADLLRGSDAINQVIGYERGKGLLALGRKAATIAELRRKSFDLTVLLTNSFESALWMALAGIPIRVGYKTDGRGPLLSHAIPRNPEPLHQICYYLDLCKTFGQVDEAIVPRVRIPSRDRDWADDFVSSLEVSSGEFLIGLCPGAAYGAAKRWMPGRFIDVCRRISENYPVKFAVFGGPGDAQPCAMVADGIGRDGINLCAKTTLRELAALLEKCALVISNDSGAMHLSAAIGTQVIALFGPTDPTQTAPPENCTVLCKHVPCSPCFKRECPTDFRCMTSISPEEVVKQASSILSASAPEGARRTTFQPTPSAEKATWPT